MNHSDEKFLQKGAIDPHARWLIAGVRPWHLGLQTEPTKQDVDDIIEAAEGRLGKVAAYAFRRGVTVSCEGLVVGDKWVPATEKRFIVRKVLTLHIKNEQTKRLSLRKPHMFGVWWVRNHKQHSRLLAGSSACAPAHPPADRDLKRHVLGVGVREDGLYTFCK